MPKNHGEPIFHGMLFNPNIFNDFVAWEFDNSSGEVFIHYDSMHHLCFFDKHELASLSKEDLLKLYKLPLSTIEDYRRDNTDHIVEKLNKFVRFFVENQPFHQDEVLEYETD